MNGRSLRSLAITATALIVLLGVMFAWNGTGVAYREGGTPAAQGGNASPVATPHGATPAASTPLSASAAGGSVSVAGDVTIELTDAGFTPDRVQSTNGHDMTLTLVNTGTRPHGFRIDRLGIDEHLQPGETTIVQISQPSLGDFVYYSDAPGDETMRGELVFYI